MIADDILGMRADLTESECWELQKMLQRVGHFPVLDAIANLIEPHIAEDGLDARARREFARKMRDAATRLPDVRY